MNNKRIGWIDELKAIVISMVVLGHAFYLGGLGMDYNLVIRFIKPIEMPLFMFLSGYVLYNERFDYSRLAKKVRRLLVPYVSWGVIFIVTKGCTEGYSLKQTLQFAVEMVYKPDLGLWFLYVLAGQIALIYLMRLISGFLEVKEELCNCILSLVLLVILFVSNFKLFGFHWFVWHYPFVLSGYYFRKHEGAFMSVNRSLRVCKMCLAMILFLFGLTWWRWKGCIALPCGVVLNGWLADAYRYGESILGTVVVISFCLLFKNASVRVLWNIGRMTLGIYAVHIYMVFYLPTLFVGFSRMRSGVGVFLIFMLTFMISIAMVLVIRLNKRLAWWLLGERSDSVEQGKS